MSENITNRNQENVEIFEKLPIPKAIQKMAIPTIISQLIVLIYNIADTFFIGRTNNPYMVAGASLILPVFNLALVISSFFGSGGGSLISRLLGANNLKEARKVFNFSFYLSLICSSLVSLSIFLFLNPLLKTLGAGPETFEYAKTYVTMVIILGGIPTVMSNTLSMLIRSVGDSIKAGFGITLGGIINIILDPIFMFILFPKGQEILGAGAATCLSNIIACIYFAIVLINKREDPVLKFLNPLDFPNKSNIKSIIDVGFPSAIGVFLFDIDYIVLDRLTANYHAIALAAIGIVLKAERLPLNIGIGIAQGMLPVVAYNYSSKNFKRMKEAQNYSLKLGIICSILSIIFYELFANFIMHIFINDTQTVQLGIYFLRVRVLATPLMFISFFFVYVFNAYGKGGYALFLAVLRWLVLNIPMLFLLDHLIGLNGLVWSQVTADTINVICSIIIYQYYKKHYLVLLEKETTT